MEGFALREIAFQPTFQKFANETVRGFQIHVRDRIEYRPVRTTVAILRSVRQVHPEHPLWRDPPYEYEATRLPIDLIAGTDRLRRDLDGGIDLGEIESLWERDIDRFREATAPLLLYR
jgi:uncharacterized protein YbbC (DUF1343 family)